MHSEKTFPKTQIDYAPKTPLCERLLHYRSDKCPQINHSYSESYFTLFEPIQNNVTWFLEIGIGSRSVMKDISSESYHEGASLKAFRDFFPKATIVGVDNDPEVLFQEERIATYLMDQSRDESITAFITETQNRFMWDIVLDDGSHNVSDMLRSLKLLFPHIKRNGIYIIEDIKRSDMEIFINAVPEHAYIVMIHEGIGDWDSFIVYKKV